MYDKSETELDNEIGKAVIIMDIEIDQLDAPPQKKKNINSLLVDYIWSTGILSITQHFFKW